MRDPRIVYATRYIASNLERTQDRSRATTRQEEDLAFRQLQESMQRFPPLRDQLGVGRGKTAIRSAALLLGSTARPFVRDSNQRKCRYRLQTGRRKAADVALALSPIADWSGTVTRRRHQLLRPGIHPGH